MHIPLVIAHVGPSATLSNAVEVASHYGNDIVLIGDAQARSAARSDALTFADSRLHSTDIQAFQASFVNLSTNAPNFEFICMARWILINDYLQKAKIKRAWCLDSDVLFFANADEIAEQYFQRSRITLSHGSSGHLISNVSQLDIETHL